MNAAITKKFFKGSGMNAASTKKLALAGGMNRPHFLAGAPLPKIFPRHLFNMRKFQGRRPSAEEARKDMRMKNVLAGTLVSLLLAVAAPGADRYEIDPVHTLIGFSVRHLVINNVKGKFGDFSGTILYDENDITRSSVEVTVRTPSINTGVNQRDDDLRSPNFLEVAKYPEMTFRSSRIERQGEGYVAVGTLTLHGVAKQVALPFTLSGKIKDPWGNERIGVEANLTIDRRDWGINFSKTMDSGGLIVGNEVRIELNVEAVKKK